MLVHQKAHQPVPPPPHANESRLVSCKRHELRSSFFSGSGPAVREQSHDHLAWGSPGFMCMITLWRTLWGLKRDCLGCTWAVFASTLGSSNWCGFGSLLALGLMTDHHWTPGTGHGTRHILGTQ